jgi:hypothetical protein
VVISVSEMALSKIAKDEITKLIADECQKAETNANLIISAPQACCMIEILTVLASCAKPISLVCPNGKNKFEHLKTPDSFKASLYQVINEMSDAFRVAHNSMTKINNNLKGMPSILNDIFEGIADPEDTQEIIDDSMKSIKVIANNCTKAADEAVSGCSSALKTIEELNQGTVATQERSDARLEAAKKEEEIAKKQKEQDEKVLKELTEHVERQKRLADEALEDYKKLMSQNSDMGNMFMMALMDSFQNVVHTATSTVKDLGNFVGGIPQDIMRGAKNIISDHTYLNKKDFLSAGVEQALIKSFEEILNSDESAWKEEDFITHLGTIKAALEFKLETTTGKALCEKGKTVLAVFQLAAAKKQEWKAKYAEVKPGLKLLIESCKASATESEASEDRKVQMTAIKSQERQTMMQVQQKNMETAQQFSKQQQELAEALRKDKQRVDEKLNETVLRLAQLNTEKLDLASILFYLKQGIEQLTQVQVAWKKVLAFFDHIKNTVDGPLILSMKEFIPSDDPKNPNVILSNTSNAKLKKLIREATKACAIGNVLMEISQLYITVSDKHIMPILDQSVLNMALNECQAKNLQHQISQNFSKKKNEIEGSIESFQKSLSKNVYANLQSQGFDMNRAIADSRKKALPDKSKE